ncbi:thiosulfate oxidation carrier protein SoxY [Roseicella aerolata]|uniref:Thiosulfate oxidation carrier protein SoxY n=1 Tax=Roseicella aerolata TaxID=2883479 RepID=A0A9X1LA32_9PROT|nr:thiosulfate oxidation carrier protein SoxY [Roseicella aerolata]MCB4821800.1 thiosulfate oxidation carrier protein SoxY [Roseicella aerolata]
MRIARRPLLLTLAALPFGARATPSLEAAMRELIGEAQPEEGGIALRLPATAENGGQVPLTVAVESPMTPAEHVVRIHLLATRNPTPGIASFHLTPALARAEVQTRIRLAEDQQVVALAVLSDGRVRRAAAETRVVTGGCIG